jgi:UDP-N-acetylglucosamine diphosphorylase / glucose-1-phosphate thymidylyltransferase / UDP-N-acetylgalactosamine diphosphorylase / glucosamine-1-phosphate N-acetyltransferase / galactosamine-1-phosphate N-acetyltransferase
MKNSLFIPDFVAAFEQIFPDYLNEWPWIMAANAKTIILKKIQQLSADFTIRNDMAIHKTAVVEDHAVLKGPLIISKGCFVAAHTYLRQGVYLGDHVTIGPGCELKSSFIFSETSLAHFNFVGDSILGSRVNMEAGAVIANHFNERTEKEITITLPREQIPTGKEKFGALVGDHSKIGANAVLSPGSILLPESIVGRLKLIE